MNTIKCDTNKFIKYIMITIIIYAILRVIPMQPMNNRDSFLLVVVILVCIIFVDNINLKENFETSATQNITSVTQNATSAIQDTTSSIQNSTQNISSNLLADIKSTANSILPKPLNTNELIPDSLQDDNIPIMATVQQDAPERASTMCDVELERIKKDFDRQINELKNELSIKSMPGSENVGSKYYNFLINDLLEKGIIDSNDVKNINTKLTSKLLTMNDVITSLEQLKKDGVPKSKGKLNDFAYSELPSEFYSPIGDKIANQWDNDYNILDTNRWQVPMQRPPVCINSEPCKICPLESAPGTTNLKSWDTSRKVTDIKVNKKWANNQMSA